MHSINGGSFEITSLYEGLLLKLRSTGMQPIVHFNFRAASTFPVPVCTVPHEQNRQSTGLAARCNKVDAVRLYASYRCIFTFTKGAEVTVRG